jgi:hypothetical protein
MIHIKLHDRRRVDPGEPMGRDWVGYDPNLPTDVLFKQNRGRWVLGPRAEREDYALFSYTGDHTIKFVAEIDGYEMFGGKRAIVGRVLDDDHPVAQRWVGAPAPDNFRNPATYFEDPSGGPSTCACGCGEPVAGNRMFASGHDQKAIHARIAKQWGNTIGFIDWFDATYPDQRPTPPDRAGTAARP